jgi:Predicted acetyltransferase
MIFTEYRSASEFASDVMGAVMKYEIQNNLVIKNIGDGAGKTMLNVKDDAGNLLLTAVRTLPFPMVMFETDNIRRNDAISFFATSLAQRGIEVTQFMTEKLLAANFARFYGEATGKKFENYDKLVLYVIDKAPDISITSGKFRRAETKDMYYLCYWSADFAPACNIGAYDLDAAIDRIRGQIAAGSLYIWEDGLPVSMAATVREVSGCKIIGQVYTPPFLRGQGYSTACVASLTKSLFTGGDTHCALYADCANPYSNSVYRKIGYRETFWYDQYREVR